MTSPEDAAASMMLQLYVAGESPNSARALRNLRAICTNYLEGHYHLEVVDVFEEPSRPLANGVLVTPTLLKISPPPGRQIIGDLSDTAQVLLALGVMEAPP